MTPSVVDLSDLPPSQALPKPWLVPDLVDVDTETSGLHPDDGAVVTVVSLAWRDGDTIYAGAWPFGQGRDDRPKTPPEQIDVADLGPGEWQALLRWLSRAGGGLSGHNIVFDLQMLALQQKPRYPGRDLSHRLVWDTMIAAQELWPERESHALKALAVDLLDEDADAEQKALAPHLGTKADPRYDRVPWAVMRPYALADAVYTNRIRHIQGDLIWEGHRGARHITTQLQLTRAILDMQLLGVPYDPGLSRRCAEILEEASERIGSGLPFKPTPVGAKDWFFKADDGPRVKPFQHTPTGQPALTSDLTERLVEMGIPHAESYLRFTRYRSAVSKWYGPFADRAGQDNRIRTSFRQGKVRSSRLSASRINLQAVPNDFHIKLPVPTPRQLIMHAVSAQHPGWELWDLDLATAELRIASMYAGCRRMLDLIGEGRDAHGETATALFGTRPGDAEYPKHRNVAKRGNFSLIFGSGARTFRDMVRKESGVELTPREATDIVEKWRGLYPEFGSAIDYHSAVVQRCGYVELPNGRRRYYAKGEDSHSAFNQLVQTMQAEFTKQWLIDTNQMLRCYRRWGGGLLLMVHDSLVMLLPATQAEREIARITEYGTELWSRFFPDVPGKIDCKRWSSEIDPIEVMAKAGAERV